MFNKIFGYFFSFFGLERDPILDDEEIRLLTLLYKEAPNSSKAKQRDHFESFDNNTWFQCLRELQKNKYITTDPFVRSPNTAATHYISFKGKMFLYEIASRQESARNGFVAIMISALIGIGAIFFSTLDYYGDLGWQASQLEQLEKLNTNLEVFIEKIEDFETSSE